MVSRAAHYRAKAKHEQREFEYVAPAPLDDNAWFSTGTEACRDLAAKQDNVWGISDYATHQALPEVEAERRLRMLSKMGFLRMAAERIDGVFSRYTWSMVDPNLPRN